MNLLEISQGLWFIFFGLSVVFGIIMGRKAFTEGLARSQREYYLGITIFLFIHLVARVFYFYYDFIFVEDPFYWEWGAITGIAGIVFLMYAIERHIFTRSNFLFTVLTIISVILLLLLPPDLGTYVQSIIVPIIGALIPLIYLYIAIKSAGAIRRNSLYIALGIFIFLCGQIAHSKTFFEIGDPIYCILSPILMITGGIMFFYGFIK